MLIHQRLFNNPELSNQIPMSFKKNDRVIYKNDKGDIFYAYIQKADEKHDLYFLHENLDPVSGSKLKLNTEPNFAVPNAKPEFMQINKDFIIDDYVAFLKEYFKDPAIEICRELHMIYLKLKKEFKEPSKEKEYVDKKLAEAGLVIDELNTRSDGVFHSELPVIFKHEHRGIPLPSIWI